MTITVRIATAHDIDTVFAIRTSVRQNHLSREQLTEMGITPEALLDAIGNGDARLWIAEVDGAAAPTGFTRSWDGGRPVISSMAISVTKRRRGNKNQTGA